VRVLLHNEKHLSIEQELNIGNTKYFKTIGILTKPNNIGLDIKKKTNEISLWELINYLKEIDIKVKSIKNKIKKKTTIPCLITSRQEIIDVILRKNLIHNDTTIIVKSKNQALDVRRKIISKSNNKKKIYIEYCRKKTFRNFQYYLEHFNKERT